MTMRKILAITSCLLTTLGLLLSFNTRATAEGSLNDFELQTTLATKFNKWTNNGACRHKLHLIVYLNTGNENFRGCAAWTVLRDHAWTKLLDNYFQPGDKIDLVSFGKECVPFKSAKPASETSTQDDWTLTQDYWAKFAAWLKDSAPHDTGTLPEMAQLDALKQGSKASDQEDLLILVFTYKSGDGSNAQGTAEDNIHSSQLRAAIKTFNGETSVSTPEILNVTSGSTSSALFIWHYFRPSKSQDVATPERKVLMEQPQYNNSTESTPPDNRGKYLAVAVLLLLIPVAGITMMKSTVQVTVNNVPRNITVSAWERIPVRVSLPTADQDTVVELMLANMPQTPMPIGEIDARTPGVAFWKRLDGYLAEGAAEGSHLNQSTEVPLPYGVPTTVQVWTDIDQPGLASKVTVQPARWIEGKLWPIMALVTCWLIALVLLGAASQRHEEPNSSSTRTDTTSVCSGGSSLSQP